MSVIKNFKIIFLSFFFLFLSTQGKSEVKVAFIQMDILIYESSAGKSLIEQLNKIDKKNKKNFKSFKEKLDKEKSDLSQKKNILSKDEYEKKVIDLNKKFKSFQEDVKNEIKKLQSKKNIGVTKILNELNLMLNQYSNKNELTFIIDQKNIIIGKSDLNITNKILKSLNEKLPKININ
ncbi:OmpH family outer membrane protein [Candidatus Pelagibacter sp.]|nr:OmpH family outer membrane protein [Candidatus Pelagibacter sp.]